MRYIICIECKISKPETEFAYHHFRKKYEKKCKLCQENIKKEKILLS